MPEPVNASDQHMRLLDDGNEIPVLGLGVWQVPNGPECVDAVLWALELGYRHIDTAQAYGNEESVGRALRRSGIRREEVFITTKFNPSGEDATRELGHSLERMGVDYVDLYLIHWPRGGATWAWPAMEQAHRLGLARSIGVSNFNVKELQEVMAGAVVPPAVDQVQLSPFHYRRALLHEGQERGLVFEAYSPLGTGHHLAEASVQRIAARIDRTAAQVLLRWCLQHHLVVLPKSVHRERIEENSHVFDFTLTADDMAELDGLDRTGGTDRALERKWW
jgi:2,5-diketo-D-gluconate reductase A